MASNFSSNYSIRPIRSLETAQAVAAEYSIPHHHLTHTLRTLLIIYIFVISFWVVRKLFLILTILSKTNDRPTSPHKSHSDANLESGLEPHDLFKNGNTNAKIDDIDANKSSVLGSDGIAWSSESAASVKLLKDRGINGHPASDSLQTGGGHNDQIGKKSSSGESKSKAGSSSNAPPPVTLDQFLNKLVLFGALLIYFYLCDFYKIFPQGQREYSRDTFLFLVFILFLVASVFTVKTNKDTILNREQTEEWKGWMQVMFVWYHYFMAKEWYNWIRIYIACYVWMTGFGNFSFFWIRKDFSLWRWLKMFFRLNFLVTFVCMVTNNEYMLYYICAMHTYWFFTVYVFMRVLNSWNTCRVKMAAKFVAYAVCNAIIFEIPGASQMVFHPFKFILGRHDHHEIMHEWSFRAGLDHWACLVGMLCAYNYPTVEKFSAYLDSPSHNKADRLRKIGIRTTIGVGALGAAATWYFLFMRKEKYAYNALHPYSSVIFILVFIVLRNIHPVLRSYHLEMFSWLGKITLETYLSQLHIYLLSNATTLLLYLPGYPLLNFSLATIIYLGISHCLFSITNDCSNFLISKDRKQLVTNGCCVIILFGIASLVSYGMFL